MTGHQLGAAGAVEAIVVPAGHAARRHSAHHQLRAPGPALRLGLRAQRKARKSEVNVAMSNSFGFGGHNAVLVFRKLDMTDRSDSPNLTLRRRGAGMGGRTGGGAGRAAASGLAFSRGSDPSVVSGRGAAAQTGPQPAPGVSGRRGDRAGGRPTWLWSRFPERPERRAGPHAGRSGQHRRAGRGGPADRAGPVDSAWAAARSCRAAGTANSTLCDALEAVVGRGVRRLRIGDGPGALVGGCVGAGRPAAGGGRRAGLRRRKPACRSCCSRRAVKCLNTWWWRGMGPTTPARSPSRFAGGARSWARGRGTTKKAAEQAAAADALAAAASSSKTSLQSDDPA